MYKRQTRDRLRFDFTHFSAMTPEEIRQVEEIVNKEIHAGLSVVTDEMSLEDAKKTGAMALFGEKYGETVRVVRTVSYTHLWLKQTVGVPLRRETERQKENRTIFELLVAAGERLMRVIRKNRECANKDIKKFTADVLSLIHI